jgi:hypothetical protein
MLNIIVSNLNYIALAFALMLSGCYQNVNKYDMDRAIKYCGSYEDVIEISALMVGAEHVLCSSGEVYSLSRPKN